jgi:outer membrane protein assembly factor BamD
MLEQFPDSPLIPRAKQRLREVQEVLAQRQFEIGEFYASREQWAPAVARLETITDTYPLFSHSDQALITIGDAYANEAQIMSRSKIPPKAKAELIRYFDDRAAASWSRVVTRYPLAPHVEDAKDRLIAMGKPVPDPSPQALAESQAEEDSRVNVKLGSRTLQLLGRGPNTVKAARVGEPSLNSPPPILAPDVVKESATTWDQALHNQPVTGVATPTAPAANAAIENGTAPPTTEHPAQKAAFQDVPNATGAVTVEIPSDSALPAGGSPGAASAPAPAEGAPASAALPGNAEPLVKPVGTPVAQPLPAIDKPAEAPQQINQVQGGTPAQVQTGANASGKPSNKKKKAPYDKKDESSSKHKKKTGLDKVNPF